MLKLARHAMRTRFEIAIADDLDPADLRAAGEEALEEIDRVEALLSAFRTDSELLRVNAEAAAGPVKIDARVFRLLERALELCAATDGAFDMTVGPLLKLWNIQSESAEAASPDDATIISVRATVGMRENLILDNDSGTVRFARAGVRLDPGAIGKGYALDRAAQVLRDAGIKNALLHGGTSSVAALGSETGKEGWKIAVRHPERKDDLLAEVLLRDGQNLSVSALHGKRVENGGVRYGHVVDPRTGRPVENAFLAAVVCDSGTDADALSTGLIVLGAAGLESLAVRWPAAGWLVVERGETMTGVKIVQCGEAFSLHT